MKTKIGFTTGVSGKAEMPDPPEDSPVADAVGVEEVEEGDIWLEMLAITSSAHPLTKTLMPYASH